MAHTQPLRGSATENTSPYCHDIWHSCDSCIICLKPIEFAIFIFLSLCPKVQLIKNKIQVETEATWSFCTFLCRKTEFKWVRMQMDACGAAVKIWLVSCDRAISVTAHEGQNKDSHIRCDVIWHNTLLPNSLAEEGTGGRGLAKEGW